MLSGFSIFSIAVVFFAVSPAANDGLHEDQSPRNPKATFVKANESYEKGDYSGAVEQYSELERLGIENADLYYNIGNAYYKIERIGRAILYYERARRINPRNKDINENLALANLMLQDKQFVKKESWLGSLVAHLSMNLTLDESIFLTSCFYMLLSVLSIAFIFFNTRLIRSVHSRFFALSPGRFLGMNPRQDFLAALVLVLVLCMISGGLALDKYTRLEGRRTAIIVEEEVLVYSAPSKNSTVQFRIHEGTRTTIKETRNGWQRISLPGGLSGWIPAGPAERI